MDGTELPALEKIDIAKRMAANNDYLGARSRLLEVHNQFPSLSNLPQMITACDILCAAELTLPDNETDWYWVLQLSPAATTSLIRLQHNKFTVALEGIKEEFPGAITALKMIHDAFFILSNKPKRLVFDSKRLTSCGIVEPYISPVSSVDNTGSHIAKSPIKEEDYSLGCESSVSKNSDVPLISGSVGERCSTLVELDISGKLLQDLEIHNAANAKYTPDIDEQKNGVHFADPNAIQIDEVGTSDNTVVSIVDHSLSTEKSLPDLSATQGQRSDEGFRDVDDTRKTEGFEVGQIWAAYDNENLPRRYARINFVSKSPFELKVTWLRPVPESANERKWCEVGLPVVCGLFNLQENEESLLEGSVLSHSVSYTASPTYDEFQIYPQDDEIWAIYKDWKPFEWCENPDLRIGCSLQVIQILYSNEEEGVVVAQPIKFDESQKICLRNTEEGGQTFEIPMSCFYRFSHRLQLNEFQVGERSGVPCGMLELDSLTADASCSNLISQSSPSTSSSLNSRGDSLKMEWTSVDFASGQVWAIYNGPDQMPRQYVVVNNVIQSGIVGVTLLEPHPMHEEEISWIEENLPLGCGVFKVGTKMAPVHMCKFSHLVNCDRSTKQLFYRIYPKKGEVWAMFRNWNSKWKRQDFGHSHCRIVQVTSDFSEQSGVQVASLEQVPGFRTFFQKQLCDGFALNRAVRRSEMLSFSHRVEAFVVPGIQAHGIPECSWHLEPDALPPILSN